eukprot:9887866-Lingulodinium_polyedra.AAC.1
MDSHQPRGAARRAWALLGAWPAGLVCGARRCRATCRHGHRATWVGGRALWGLWRADRRARPAAVQP